MAINIVKKVKEITLGDKDYIMTFDMRSIPVFKELSGGKNFLASTHLLGQFDDEVHIAFMGATIRSKDTPTIPIGAEVFEMDTISMLMGLSWDIIEIVTGSMPQSNAGPKVKRKK